MVSINSKRSQGKKLLTSGASRVADRLPCWTMSCAVAIAYVLESVPWYRSEEEVVYGNGWNVGEVVSACPDYRNHKIHVAKREQGSVARLGAGVGVRFSARGLLK